VNQKAWVLDDKGIKKNLSAHFSNLLSLLHKQEAPLSPSDRAMRLVSSKSCQLPCNSAETTYTTSPDQTDGMKLEIQLEEMRDRQRALNHNANESAPIVSGVINKPMTVELCISPVYRRLAVAKFSKSTM